MKITAVTRGTLHVIESSDGQTLKFEADSDSEPLQLLAVIEQIGKHTGYDVSRYGQAKVTLIVEADEEPQYQQTL